MKEKELERLTEIKKIEEELYKKGTTSIAGIDEAGRGPLAGPVVVACVVMPRDSMIEGVNDSKKVSEKKREKLYEEITNEALGCGVGIISQEDKHIKCNKRRFNFSNKKPRKRLTRKK